jgi:hypothetical protein
VYGRDGEKTFIAHRNILCGVSEWFMRASKNFKEASDRQILLKDDNPQGLEALFEYAYTHTYTVVEDDNEPNIIVQFKQHIHVFATADKYQAEGLGELAFHRLGELVRVPTEIKEDFDPLHSKTMVGLFRWMVEQVYVHQKKCFPALEDPEDSQEVDDGEAEGDAEGATSPTYSPASPLFDPPSQSFTPTSPQDGSTSLQDGPTSPRYAPISLHHDLTNLSPAESINDDEPSMHPIDRVQQLLVDGAMKVWKNENKQVHFTRKHLVPITQEFPDFGTDLACTALKTPQLRF